MVYIDTYTPYVTSRKQPLSKSIYIGLKTTSLLYKWNPTQNPNENTIDVRPRSVASNAVSKYTKDGLRSTTTPSPTNCAKRYLTASSTRLHPAHVSKSKVATNGDDHPKDEIPQAIRV